MKESLAVAATKKKSLKMRDTGIPCFVAISTGKTVRNWETLINHAGPFCAWSGGRYAVAMPPEHPCWPNGRNPRFWWLCIPKIQWFISIFLILILFSIQICQWNSRSLYFGVIFGRKNFWDGLISNQNYYNHNLGHQDLLITFLSFLTPSVASMGL